MTLINQKPGAQRIGEAVAAIRFLRRTSQTELARMIGVSPSHISNLEKGKVSPSIELMERVCNSLSVSMSELFLLAENIERDLVAILIGGL